VTKAVFLDRDGVINRKPAEGDYVTRWEDFKFLPRVVGAIALLNRAGFYVIVVTNQRCIAKGLLTVAELETIHQRMSDFLTEHGARIDAIYYCPHDMKPICRCRKPAPGMLIDAARDHKIELTASWMIGDSDFDIEAGRNAGCKTARLLDGNGEHRDADRGLHDEVSLVANSLLEAVRQVLRSEKQIEAQESVGSQVRPSYRASR
jgi:D-glycero-D-manno-heptose 1,7-bisphosphate phosphatase